MNKPIGVNPKRTVAKNITGKKGAHSKFTLVAIICLLLVATLTGCTPKAPHEHWVAALKKVNDLDYLDYVTTASMNFQTDDPQAQEIFDIFNQITCEVTMKVDKEDHRFLIDTTLLYKGINCGNLTLYCDLEKITARSIFLGPKTFYFEWKDLQLLVEKFLGFQLQITDYFPLLLETDEEIWEQVELAIYDLCTNYYQDKITAGDKQVKLAVTENDQEITITCRELILQMDNDDFSPQEIHRLLQDLIAQPAIRALIKDKITQFINIAKNNGDLATWPITEEELIAFRDDIDAHINRYVDLMTTIIAQAETTSAPTSIAQVDGKIYIDQKGLWRSVLTDQTMHFTDPNTGEVSLVTVKTEQKLINPGQKPSFPDFLSTNTVNIGQTSAEELETLGDEIYLNLFAQLMVNPLFQDILQLSSE